MFAYPCPFCAQRLMAAPERAGQRTICPKCLKPIVIPRAEAPAQPVESQVPASVPDAANTQRSPGPATPNPSEAESTFDFLLGVPSDSDHSDTTPEQTPLPQNEPPPRPATGRSPRLTAAIGASAPALRPPSRADFEVPPRAQTPPKVDNPRPKPVPPTAGSSESSNADSGVVMLAPTGVESADLAAELTAALTFRMPPPPEPPGDLKLSTGLWLTLTAVGASLWLYSLLYNPLVASYAALIGVVQFAMGYAWVVSLEGRRERRLGWLTLLPPVALDRLLRPRSSQGYRPLRFVITGVILFALVLLAPAIRPKVQRFVGMDEEVPQPVSVVTETPPDARLRDLMAEENIPSLVDELADLTARNTVLRATTKPEHKTKLVAELRTLVGSKIPEVRIAALQALVAWIDDEAKPEVITVLASEKDKERHAAMKICTRWKDLKVADAVAARLSNREDTYEAMRTLAAIGKDGGAKVVESALLTRLTVEEDIAITAIRELTVEFGGEPTIKALKALEAAAPTPETSRAYRDWWQSIARYHKIRA